MRARDDQRLARAQKKIIRACPAWTGKNPLVQDVFQFNIAARNRIADHHQVRPRLEVGFGIRLGHRNGDRRQKIRHRRISGRV